MPFPSTPLETAKIHNHKSKKSQKRLNLKKMTSRMKARRKRRKRKRKKSPSNNNSNKLSRNSTCTPNPLKPIKINPKPKSGKPSFKSIKTDSTTKSNSKDTSRTGNKTYPKKILNSTEDNKNYKNTSEK